MKKRHEQWLKLTSSSPHAAVLNVQPPIRVIDLPGFQEMEDKLLIYAPVRGTVTPELDWFINSLSEKTFGITENDTFEDPEGYDDLPSWSEERQAINERYYEHEERFETSDASDEEAVTILLEYGLDFRDARGNPLRCTKLFARQAEAAAKSIMGKMPHRAAAGLESWAKALGRDVKKHMSRKRSA